MEQLEKVLSVPEVHCGHCVSSIEGAVAPIEGVADVKVDLEKRDVTVKFDPKQVTLEHIVGVIEEQGYDVGGPKMLQLGRPEDS